MRGAAGVTWAQVVMPHRHSVVPLTEDDERLALQLQAQEWFFADVVQAETHHHPFTMATETTPARSTPLSEWEELQTALALSQSECEESPRKKRPPHLPYLPIELLTIITKQLSFDDMCRLGCVCRALRDFVREEFGQVRVVTTGRGESDRSVLNQIVHFYNVQTLIVRGPVTPLLTHNVGALCGGSLRSLSLLNCSNLNDEDLHGMLPTLRNLRSLTLAMCLNLSDGVLRHTQFESSQIEEFTVSWWRGLTDDGMSNIARTCQRLKRLELAHCSSLTDAALRSALMLPALSTLTLSHVKLTRVSIKGAPIVQLRLSDCDGLHTVRLHGSTLEFVSFGNCRYLQSVALCTPALVSLSFSGCKSLKDITFLEGEVEKDTATTSESSRLLPTLTDLNLFGCRNIEAEVLAHLLREAPHLQHLNLNGCTGVTYLKTDLSDLASLNLMGCSMLSVLHMRALRLQTVPLSGCRSLRELALEFQGEPETPLYMKNCPYLLQAWIRAPHLRDLFISTCPALYLLDCQCASLRSLGLAGCRSLTEPALYRVVTGCPRLTRVTCKGSPQISPASEVDVRALCPSISWMSVK